MNNSQSWNKLLLLKHSKHLGKFWHVCLKCEHKQITTKFTRKCKKCGNKNTVCFVSYDGLVYPEQQNEGSVKP